MSSNDILFLWRNKKNILEFSQTLLLERSYVMNTYIMFQLRVRNMSFGTRLSSFVFKLRYYL